MIRHATSLVLVAILAAAAIGQSGPVQIKTHHVRGGIYMLEGQGGNIGVSAGPDGLVMIDDQFAQLSEKIQAALDALDKGALAFIINTHWHGDHTGGNAAFGRKAPIIAHVNVRRRMSEGVMGGERETPPAPKIALPVITFADSVSIHFNDEEVRVVHFANSHTDGDSVIFFTKSDVVHMGDLYFSGLFPFVDTASGGSVAGLIKSVEGILATIGDDTKIIPGHGPLSTKADLRAYLDMIVETRAIVAERVRDGSNLSEVKRAGLPEKWDSWSWRFINTERWLEVLFGDATGGGTAR